MLRVEPANRTAQVGLLLCLTDQFTRKLILRWGQALEVLEILECPYDEAYCHGIMCERRAKAHHERRSPQSGALTHSWLSKAMLHFAQAAEIRPAGDG